MILAVFRLAILLAILYFTLVAMHHDRWDEAIFWQILLVGGGIQRQLEQNGEKHGKS